MTTTQDQGFGRFDPVGSQGAAPPRFADGARALRVMRVQLDTATNGKKRLNITGTFLTVAHASDRGATADLFFTERDHDGLRLQLGWRINNVRFDEVYIEHTAQPGQFLDLVYGVGDGIELNAGGENAPDTYGSFLSIGGGEYSYAVQEGSTNFMHVALNNPADSNVLVVVRRVSVSEATSDVRLRYGDNISLSNVRTQVCKYIGNGAGVATITSEDLGSLNTGDGLLLLFDTGHLPNVFPRSTPLVLPPGKSIWMQNISAGTNYIGAFEWREVGIAT